MRGEVFPASKGKGDLSSEGRGVEIPLKFTAHCADISRVFVGGR